MIDFGAPIGTAYERMVGNLFRPFDIGKWFTLGFSAFLSTLLDGSSNSFNYSDMHQIDSEEHIRWFVDFGLAFWMLVSAAVIFLMAVILLVLMWLGMRGHFMLVDNVRQNQDLVVSPWKRWADASNGFFLVFGTVFLVWWAGFAIMMLAGLNWAWPYLESQTFPGFPAFAPWLFIVIGWALLLIPVNLYLFYLKEFGIPIAIREQCGVVVANRRLLALMTNNLLDMFVYALLRFAIGVACFIISLLAGCLTCCIGFLPYISAVITLPLFVYRVHFTLECLRQFGPEFDLYPETVAEGGMEPLGPQ